MANITVSTSSNFDDTANLALNHAELVTITSGATLTINSDNRYAQNSACPERIYIDDGALIVDGRDVWWIPFDNGSGTVPSLSSQGTLDVTVSGTNVGELLGVWDSFGVAKPLTAGDSMPSTGYVKLRRKVSTISDNDVLTFSNSSTVDVNSVTGGQRGWIDLVGSPFYGAYVGGIYRGGVFCNARSQLRVYGDWFELGETTGIAGQVIQHYLPTYCSAIQIETSSGSGVYEWFVSYPFNSTPAADFILDNNVFGRAFTSTTTGAMTLGYNSQFYVPPAGCKIRVPNICLNTAVTTNYDTYQTAIQNETLMWRLYGKIYSDVEIDKITIGSGRFHSDDSAKYYVTNSAFMGGCTCWREPLFLSKSKDWKFDNVAIAAYSTSTYTGSMFNISGDKVVIKNAFLTNGNSYNSNWVNASTDVEIDNVTVIASNKWHTQPTGCLYFVNLSNVKVNKIRGYAPGRPVIYLSNVENFDANDVGFVGVEQYGTASAIYSSICVQGSVKKARFNDFKNVLNYLPGGRDYFAQLSGEEIVWTNFGSYTNPFVTNYVGSVLGQGSLKYPNYRWNAADVTKESLHNIWLSSSTGASLFFLGTNTTDVSFNYCGIINPVTPTIWTTLAIPKNSRVRNVETLSVIGTEGIPYQHYITNLAQTTSQIRFSFSEFSTSDERSVNAFVNSGGFRDGAYLYLNTINSFYEITTDDILGVTALTTTTITSSGNLAFTYDVDTGTGFSGTYRTLNNTNLASETVSATGFKLRVRATATATSTNTVTALVINATTSTSDVQSNYYPIMEPKIKITGVTTGSTLAFIRVSDGKVLYISDASSTTITMRPGWYDDTATLLRARKAGYSSYSLPYPLTYKDDSIPIFQSESEIPATNPGSLNITVTNHGNSPVTWNGKQWSITITIPAGSGITAAQIANFINYNLASQSRSFDSAFYNMQFPEMVIAVGTNFETARGTLYGSTGATLKGVRVVDSNGAEVPGFARMQADDGTYYSPAASYTLTVNNIVSGSRLLLRRTDTQAVIYNNIPGTTFTHTYTHTSDIPVEIVVRKATTSPYYQEWSTTTTLSNSNNTQTANQLSDG
jgi:hypothetical protein